MIRDLVKPPSLVTTIEFNDELNSVNNKNDFKIPSRKGEFRKTDLGFNITTISASDVGYNCQEFDTNFDGLCALTEADKTEIKTDSKTTDVKTMVDDDDCGSSVDNGNLLQSDLQEEDKGDIRDSVISPFLTEQKRAPCKFRI